MKIQKTICNMCENEVEHYNDFDLCYRFGYESHHDGDEINLNLCGKCLDDLTDDLIKRCKINPLIDKSGYREDY